MEDLQAGRRRIAREEVRRQLAVMEAEGRRAGLLPKPPRLLIRALRWGAEMAGAVLLGLLCGAVSHLAIYFLGRALL